MSWINLAYLTIGLGFVSFVLWIVTDEPNRSLDRKVKKIEDVLCAMLRVQYKDLPNGCPAPTLTEEQEKLLDTFMADVRKERVSLFHEALAATERYFKKKEEAK